MGIIDHAKVEIILFVNNMDPEVRFYRDVLGLPLRYPEGLDDYSDQMWVEFSLGDAIMALHGGAEAEPQEDHQLVFWVEDVPQARAMITESGIEMGEVRPLEDGAPVSEGCDPEGHRFSIRA